MKKRFMRLSVAAFCLLGMQSAAIAQQAKYVFYFIGDGMGLNHVYATNLFLKEQGEKPLLFPTFPVAGIASTYSETNDITDSAAAGTALATGVKTKNGTISMDVTQTKSLETLADWAMDADRAVGIISSVSIDHATPAVFYAHKASRSSLYEIAADLPDSEIEFFAGGGFVQPTHPKDKKAESIFELVDDAGYEVYRGTEEYDKKRRKGEKVILIQEEGVSPSSIPNVIDFKEGDLSLPYMTESAIDFLKNKEKGFFTMVEGGMIDWASHGQDAATMIHEVIDFNRAIEEAYAFYQANPDSTLIVVTADHETGGLGLGAKGYQLNFKTLTAQKQSQAGLSKAIYQWRENLKKEGKPMTWDAMKALLQDKMGFWSVVKISDKQEARLREMYNKMVSGKEYGASHSEYYTDEPMAKLAVNILAEAANVGWTTGGHTAAQVPVYAIGAGSELFSGFMDNTDLPKKIRQAAGY